MLIPLPLDTVELNTPIPINIWDPKGVLLLRKGQSIESAQHREYLLQHSPHAHDDEFKAWTYSYTTQLDRMVRTNQSLNKIAGATRPAELNEMEALREQDPVSSWPDLHATVSTLLHQGPAIEDFLDRLQKVERRMVQLVNAQADNALFMLVQMLFDRRLGYTATHALLAGATCYLVGQGAGLAAEEQTSMFRAALTQNLGMARLQDDLARQEQPPNPIQKSQILGHPARGAMLLRAMGVTDALWLRWVEEHHESVNGSGYPAGKKQLSMPQQLIHMADVFVGRMSPRLSRRGMLPQTVARELYIGPDGQPSPLGALFVKTIGIYPPGSYVQLAGGEVAVVVRRGRRANTPVVFAIVGRQGLPLGEPALRDTTERLYEVKGSVPAEDVRVVINPTKLLNRA
jgi:HD-GYP domain-containing protein (c-di-GMP phosphodiesterase class II)